jgi:glycosyltransferase involved in cell wall biosynthesis
MTIRVLEVLPTLHRAGAEVMAVSLACRLDRARFEPAVISLYDPFPNGLEPLLEERGVPVFHLGKHRGPDPRMLPRLTRLFRRLRPDVLHTHSYILRYTLPAARLARPRAMVHTIHNLAEKEPGRIIQRWAFRRGVVPVAIAAELARSFRALYGREPAATIPNGIDTAACFRPHARDPWRAAHDFAPDDLLVASAARLEPQKNPLALIEAFARGLASEPRSHLLMAGAGSQFEAARDRAARLGLSGRVHFLGVRTDVPDLLSASDIFALASEWEGNPLAVMEAMAAGLPVVATAVGGVPELVAEGVTGLLAAPGDPRALGAALASLAEDADLRRAMGEAGRARSAHFDVANMVEGYSALFERLVAERS